MGVDEGGSQLLLELPWVRDDSSLEGTEDGGHVLKDLSLQCSRFVWPPGPKLKVLRTACW